jgi:hypothetical protein
MLIGLLILAQAAASASPERPEAASQRAGEAYGLCLATAAREQSRTNGDMDSIMAHATEACTAESEAAKQTYFAYLRSVDLQMSEADYDRMMAESMQQLRQRIAGCMETERLNRADGGRRMC